MISFVVELFKCACYLAVAALLFMVGAHLFIAMFYLIPICVIALFIKVIMDIHAEHRVEVRSKQRVQCMAEMLKEMQDETTR